MKKNKHIFIAFHDCIFITNLLSNLVYKKVFCSDDILIATIQSSINREPIRKKCEFLGFDICKWEDLKELDEINILSLNSLSLQDKSAAVIVNLVESGLVVYSQINILITDDEINRWSSLYNEIGSLQVSKKNLISEDVLKVLNNGVSYICPKTLANIIEKVLEREIKYVDAILPYTLFDYDTLSKMQELYQSKYFTDSTNYKKIMLYTKQKSHKENILNSCKIFYFLFKNHKKYYGKKFTIGLWASLGSYDLFLLQAMYFITKKTTKLDFSIELLSHMTIERYFATLYDYDVLVLQGRGGFSTAKYFAEKIGRVLVEKHTPNYDTLKYDYNYDPESYDNFYECLEMAMEDTRAFNLDKVSDILIRKHDESIEVLKSLWS